MSKSTTLAAHRFQIFNNSCSLCRYARVFDCRSENSYKKWKVSGEVEKVLWNHFNPFTFLVATETGVVQMIDVRNDEKPIWTLHAHDDGNCCGFLVIMLNVILT